MFGTAALLLSDHQLLGKTIFPYPKQFAGEGTELSSDAAKQRLALEVLIIRLGVVQRVMETTTLFST